MSKITESDIELFTIEELETLGYQFLYGPDISVDGLFQERQSYNDILLAAKLRTYVPGLSFS
jgi:type I restriction enzyme R subunit